MAFATPASGDTRDFFDLLYTGSLAYNANKTTATFINRVDARFFLPFQSFTLRTELIDKRRFKNWDNFEDFYQKSDSFINWGAGIYHRDTGSRLLYGVLDEWGLGARVRNPWSRPVPFADSRRLSASDLRTEPSETKEPEAYLLLASPVFGAFKGFASITADKAANTAFGSGIEFFFDDKKKKKLRFEGLYTERKLARRNVSPWFSEKPPLPERNFHLFALGAVFTSPFLSIASDWAFSETFAFGKGVYGNFAARFGNKPWVFSMAMEGAGDRYTGRDGGAPGQGFRYAAKIERYGKKSALFQASLIARSTALGDLFEMGYDAAEWGSIGKIFDPRLFDQNTIALSYRFPTNAAARLRLSSVSFSARRDSSNPKKKEDKYEAGVGVYWGKARYSFSCALTGVPSDGGFPYPVPYNWAFESAKIGGSMSYKISSLFQFGMHVGCFIKGGEKWDGALSLALQGNRYRVSAKIENADLFQNPQKYNCSLSWKFSL
jgi:hypothetical protein